MYSEPDKENYELRVPLPAQQSPPPSWNKSGSWQAIDVVPILADDENPPKQHSTEHSGCRSECAVMLFVLTEIPAGLIRIGLSSL